MHERGRCKKERTKEEKKKPLKTDKSHSIIIKTLEKFRVIGRNETMTHDD